MFNRIDMGVRIAGERAMKPDEFVTLGQLKAGNGIQITRSNGNIEIMSMGYDGVLQIENVILVQSEWIGFGSGYRYSYYNDLISIDSIVTVIPSNESKNSVVQAKILPCVSTENRYIHIYSESKPESNIVVNFSVSGKLFIEENEEDKYMCGETIGGHKVVFLYNGMLYIADKENQNIFGKVIGLSTKAGMPNEFISIRKENILYLDGWNLIPNSHYYLNYNGGITNAKPSTGIIQYVGFAKTENELEINIQKPIKRNM